MEQFAPRVDMYDHNAFIGMHKDDKGGWVKYSYAQSLQRQVADLTAKLNDPEYQLGQITDLQRQLRDAQAAVEALQRERDEWRSTAVAQEARANDLERDCKDLQSDIEDERAKVKGLHEITKVICGHCCEPMEIPSKAVLQTQLTQIQALVRAFFTSETEWGAAYRELQRLGYTLDATPTERGQG